LNEHIPKIKNLKKIKISKKKRKKEAHSLIMTFGYFLWWWLVYAWHVLCIPHCVRDLGGGSVVSGWKWASQKC